MGDKKQKIYKTDFNKDIWYLTFASIIGAFWRIWFSNSIKNPSDTYAYTIKFIGENIPDLGFYTQTATHRTSYIGVESIKTLSDFLFIKSSYLGILNIFLITFVFLGFVYFIFCEYEKKNLTYIGVALMALGPIELFYTTSPPYIALFSLFLFFKSEEKNTFWIALLLSIVMMFTYYTGSMIMLLASIGFVIALFSKSFFKSFFKTKKNSKTLKKHIEIKKILGFLLIIIILATYIFTLSGMKTYSLERIKDSSDIKEFRSVINPSIEHNLNPYTDPTFLGLSAIRWQVLFFFVCGLSFIFYLTKKRDFSEENIELLLCLIPILIVSYAFLHVNLPTRIFDYFAFFGLLVLKIPKKYIKIFFVLSFIFILTTSIYVAKDKKIFFEISDKEIEGALWVKDSLQGELQGRIFSDQVFVNQLILNDYYNVTGLDDKDPLVHDLFYQQNYSIFLNAIKTLNTNANLNVDYIVLTQRMQEQYILMLNTPQKPLTNIALYEDEKNLIKIYDNGDVRVYEIK